MINKVRVCVFIILLFIISSCGHDPLRDVDVSGVKLNDFVIKHMEDDVFALNPDSILQMTPKLRVKYGNFYLHYIRGFINDGGISDSSYAKSLARFISDKDMKEVYGACKDKYSSTDFLYNGLEDAFKRYKYYFPERVIPKVITTFTGFNYSILYVDTTLAISLEMYLGRDYKYYTMMSPDVFPMYRRKNMEQQYIVPDCIKGWLSLEFPQKQEGANFLTQIIQAGKTLYLSDALLPFTDDTLKIGYTKGQLGWCEKNEFNVWAFFVEKKILFSTDANEFMKYTADGPFTTDFNKESPARVGQWIGWRIVRSFMKNNPDITVAKLMETEAQTVLNRSKYKPGK